MLKNYFKIALRNIIGNALYSAINILGLGIGLACCLLIMLFLRYELSFEEQFVNADRIYRISREIYPNEGARARIPASNNAPITPALIQDFPAMEEVGRFFGGDLLLENDQVSLTEPALRFADQAILDIFGFNWIAGNPETALVEPNTIVLTESLARKYFGSTDILGQTLAVVDRFDATVTGVIEDLPDNTHLSLSGMVSMSTIPVLFGNEFMEQWNSSTDFYTYFLLQEGADVSAIEEQIPEFLDRHVGEEASTASTMRIMNIQDIHLRSDRDEEWNPPGNIGTVYGFFGIAFSILFIACINFMSISTARSAQRAREVGMRKSIGASRSELIFQFLGESCVTALMAMAVALVLIEMMLPTFSNYTGIAADFSFFNDSFMALLVVLLVLLVGVVAGSYPALFLSAFSPAKVLKGDLTRSNAGLMFRNTMVVVQFAIAISIVICTTVIYKQRDYAMNLDLGFNKDEIVILGSASPGGYREDWPTLKQELLAHPAIESVTASHFLPFGFNDNQIPVALPGSTVSTRIQYMMVDYDFFSTYGIEFVGGRTFRQELGTDVLEGEQGASEQQTFSAIINESALSALGISMDEGVNARLSLAEGAFSGSIVGIVEDTFFESIHRNVRPLIFILMPPSSPQPFQRFNDASIRFNTAATEEALAHIDNTWARLYPGSAINRHFLNQDFDAMYQQEAQQGQLFTWFSTLAIIIACFGLLGLAAFNAERRTKEIGVRKVMGSSVWGIVVLLTNDFSRLVLLSNIIAWPVAYFAMNRWLENFAYRIDLTPLIFIGSGLIALCIAWVTVGGTAAKAASARPVLALRYE